MPRQAQRLLASQQVEGQAAVPQGDGNRLQRNVEGSGTSPLVVRSTHRGNLDDGKENHMPPADAQSANSRGGRRPSATPQQGCAQHEQEQASSGGRRSVRESLSDLMLTSKSILKAGSGIRDEKDLSFASGDSHRAKNSGWRRVSFTSRRLSFDAPLPRFSMGSTCGESQPHERDSCIWPGRFSLGSSSPRRVSKLVRTPNSIQITSFVLPYD